MELSVRMYMIVRLRKCDECDDVQAVYLYLEKFVSRECISHAEQNVQVVQQPLTHTHTHIQLFLKAELIVSSTVRDTLAFQAHHTPSLALTARRKG